MFLGLIAVFTAMTIGFRSNGAVLTGLVGLIGQDRWNHIPLSSAHQVMVVLLFCLVWAADIGAYFGGRAFGRRKLAPSISPGKSWAGVWSGMVGTLGVAIAWLMFDGSGRAYYDSFYTLINERVTTIGLAFVVIFLVAMSVVGDLFESLVKRSAGAKDSSGLLPGHGGILDRIDALLPVFPIVLALAPPS